MPVTGAPARGLISPPLAWEHNPRLPRGVAAVLAALRFSGANPELLRRLTDADWKTALEFMDRGSLTLLLGAERRDHLPVWVRERMDRNLAGNVERIGRLRASLVEIAAQFAARNISYLVLKGFSQELDYAPDPYLRVGYDLDLFAPESSLPPALDALHSLGYEPVEGTGQFPADHFPPMIRKSNWQWRGDFFDAEIPGSIDLHYRFWDPETECFDAPGVEEFWERRVVQDGLPALHRADRLGYAALHLLRHLLRGSVRASHVYEIAYFLETQAGNDAFWETWRALHPAPLRRLESLSFRLAAEWFGCRVAPAVDEQLESETEEVQLWFSRLGAAPLEALFHPNKHEIWLHFALLDSSRARRRVFMRRVLPLALPGPIDAQYLPDDQVTWRMHARRQIRYAAHVAGRAAHHTRALVPVAIQGLIWKSRGWRLDAGFWRLLACSTLVNLGAFHFLLLYNLYLMDLGYRENVLGVIAGAFTAGSLAGVLPVAACARRYGLKQTLLVSIAATAVVSALRAGVPGEPALLAAAFAGGVLFSTWAVCLSPAVAAVTSERARPTAFSFVFGSGIGLGVAAGILGGRLPGWILRSGLASSPAGSKQLVLFAASASVALALWPLGRIRLHSPPADEKRAYPGGPFIRRFLAAIGVWGLATGSFNPLFNAYFARQFHMPVDRIGLAFSIAQAASAAALVLAAPFLLRRLGLIRGVAATQLATAASLALLAPAPTALVAMALYAAYASFQYMTEPGIYTSLMNRVPASQHSGASALNFLVIFASQAVAASLAGAVVSRFGYPPMLWGAAGLAVVAAWLFSRLKYDS